MPKVLPRLAVAASAALLLGTASAPVTAAAKTSVQPTGLTTISEVSHTGQWVRGDKAIVDRTSAAATPAARTWFVRDNPALRLTVDAPIDVVSGGTVVGYRSGAVWLASTGSQAQFRVDTDASGTPLVPTWTGTELDEPDANDHPMIWVGPESVTRDGSMVAFCANYEQPNVFTLYIKDLTTGALTKRPEACSAGGPVLDNGDNQIVRAPEVSFNGSVVHVRGTLYMDGRADPQPIYYADTLVFPKSGKPSRTIKGQGSMTRDGKSVFLRIGVVPAGAPDTTKGRVGVYRIPTKKTKKLAGATLIYGTNALWFSAFDQASWRGRYVVHGNKARVTDRTTGKATSIAKVMAKHGYTVDGDWYAWQPYISGDGKRVFLRSGGTYVAVDWR
jgi:hypothetical protein